MLEMAAPAKSDPRQCDATRASGFLKDSFVRQVTWHLCFLDPVSAGPPTAHKRINDIHASRARNACEFFSLSWSRAGTSKRVSGDCYETCAPGCRVVAGNRCGKVTDWPNAPGQKDPAPTGTGWEARDSVQPMARAVLLGVPAEQVAPRDSQAEDDLRQLPYLPVDLAAAGAQGAQQPER
jgi:hypothetical protein